MNLPLYNKALAHPVRIEIIKLLSEKSRSCGEIVDLFNLAQSTVSQHLHELVKSNLIEIKKIKTKSIYNINWNEFENYTESNLIFIKEVLTSKD